jgi:RNA polymerase sigma factor (sigma-70 family)
MISDSGCPKPLGLMDANADDIELLERWAGGCRAAGGTLLTRHGPVLLRFFATKAPEAADDLAQATLLACLENTDQLREKHCFKSYLFGIARHLLYQHYRARAMRRGKLSFNTTSVLDKGRSPSTLVARSCEDVNLMRALSTLPTEMRILLELTYWEDLPAAGIAGVLGVAENTVYSRLHRAKQRLKLALERFEAPERADTP